MKKDIIISFGVDIYPTNFNIENVLSSMEFEEMKAFIAEKCGV